MASDSLLFSKARDVWEWTVVDGFKCNGKRKGGDIQTSQRALEFISADTHAERPRVEYQRG
jgi:hypothetical protein